MFLKIKLNDEQLERAQKRVEEAKMEIDGQHRPKGNLACLNEHLYQGDFNLSLQGNEIEYVGSEYWFHEECFMKLVQIADYDTVQQARDNRLERFEILETDFSSFQYVREDDFDWE